jgi:hypothetical protein
VVFSDAVLEPSTSEYFDIQWGYAPDPNNPAQLATVQLLSRNRAYRALIIPYALVDVEESINRFSPKFGSVLSGFVVINHPSAESFSSCTFEDAKWLVRKMQSWTAQDYQAIVHAGAFPPELESLVTAKLMYRAHNAFEMFGLSTAAQNLRLPSLDINSSSGLVAHGKVTQEMVPGYPQRFAHGDRSSPIQEGDIERYIGIRSKATAITTAISQINQKLDLLSINDLYAKRRLDIQNRIIQHIQQHPLEPLYQQVEAWGGPVGGFNLAATRHLTTGTYYGSSAAIQLVDDLSVSGQLGYFMALDGIPKITPVGGANIVVTRDYTHVRPLLSVQEGTKVKWQDLILPKFMKDVSAVLAGSELVAGADANSPKRQPLDAFLSDLREGEVFTITDSVALAAYAQVSASLDVLMGFTPLNFLNSVALGADGSRVILRQTSFMRTKEGVQVYVRNQNSKAFGLTLDVNYFINLLNIRASTTTSQLHTDAFIIDYNPEYADLIDQGQGDQNFVKKFIQTRDNLKPALYALFRHNDTELLYSRFKYQQFAIDHDLKTKEVRAKMTILRASSFTEDHTVKILYPRSPDAPDLNPADEQVILFANKRGELKGRDLLGFVTDLIQGITNKFIPNAHVDLGVNTDDPNPANTPYGKAYWKIIDTEGDLTPKGQQYPNVANIQHVWGGWHMKQKAFFNLIDDIQDQFKNTKIASYRLIEKEAFANVTSIDFYRVTANLSVLPGGLDRVRDLILQPDANGKPVKKSVFIGRLFQKISEKMGHPARANDKELFDDIMTIIGNGNHDKGLGICNDAYNDNHKNGNGSPGAWINGTYFDCMMPWVEKLMDLSANYPKDKTEQIRWATNVLYVLDEQIPLPQLLKFLGEPNYIFLVRVNGFRTGDEDGDIEYFSNTLGDPKQNLDYANGLIAMFATKTRISPIELDRTQGSFR